MTDKNSRGTYVNQRWTAITGVGINEFIAGKLQDLIHVEDRDDVLDSWRDFAQGKTSVYNLNYRLLVDGLIKYISCHAVPVLNELGELSGFLGTIQDLTELHSNQIALANSSRMSSLGQMAGGIAHEINNPLTIISGKTEILRLLLEKPEFDRIKAKEHLGKIQQTAHRIAKIVKGLKSIARETSGDPVTSFSLKQVVQDTLEFCENRFAAHGVELRRLGHLEENIRSVGHPEQITQVMLNLLNNAFDAVQNYEEKWVELSCEVQFHKIHLQVRDSGKGIDDKMQRQLFNPFFTTKQVGEGTGLGLSISKAIIEKHGGRLFYERINGHTAFIVELDLLEDFSQESA